MPRIVAEVTLVSAVRLKPGVGPANRVLQERAVNEARRLGGLLQTELIPAIEGVQAETVALLTVADWFRELRPLSGVSLGGNGEGMNFPAKGAPTPVGGS